MLTQQSHAAKRADQRPNTNARRAAEARAADPDGLTKRQREVFELRMAGKTAVEIAKELGIALVTTQFHFKSVLELLSPERRVQLREAMDSSPAFTREEREQVDSTVPGCARCYLRGPHVCLPATAVELTGTRRGVEL